VEQRIRAAAIIFQDGKMLLVKHVDPSTGEEWWIPPGGGLEAHDLSIIDAAVRETFEETGLRVSIGKLVYLREFIEKSAGVHHVELFFLADSVFGELTMENVAGAGPDELYIQDLKWLSRKEMVALVVWPEHLKQGFWDDLESGFPEVRFLDVHEA